MKKKVLLIDGNSFCYRAFYAIRQLSNSKGIATNAIYGFVTMLNKLLNQRKPDYLAVVFDLKAPTFRHKKFSEYKIQRKPMPDDLKSQLSAIRTVVQAYHIPIFEQEGFEADDVIATLAKRLSSKELEILILSADKDMLQIVNDDVKVLNPQQDNLVIDAGWVKKRYGVAPEKLVEVMALCGDASDNVPGIPGVGEAGAIELIKRFGALEDVLKNADQITNKTKGQKIKQFSETARLSKELVTLDADVAQLARKNPQELLEQMQVVPPDKQRLYELFKEFEFKTLLKEVIPENKSAPAVQLITERDRAERALDEIKAGSSVALYFCPFGLALSLREEESVYFSLEQTLPANFKALLENKAIKKIGHDLKYIKVVLSNQGINLQGLDFDTMIAAYLLDPSKGKFTLADLTLEYLDYKLEEPCEDNTKNEQAQFCARSVQTILKMSKPLNRQLQQKGLLDLFHRVE
ncbi:MAG: hypothetical protein JW714_00405, partial [Candidatus Omnitrophica bacterium]|nr:hypothetical protein [Candidatus Omnitrophota bacterium]